MGEPLAASGTAGDVRSHPSSAGDRRPRTRPPVARDEDVRPTVLVADPSGSVADAVGRLERVRWEILEADGGAEALYLVGMRRPQLVILADTLVDVTVETVTCVVRRHSTVPILIGVLPGQDLDAAGRALMAGATTLVTLPLQPEELAPHIRLAMDDFNQERRELRSVLRYGPLELDSQAITAKMNGVDLGLPLKEFEILRLFMLRPNQVITTAEMIDELWKVHGPQPSSNSFVVHIGRLRHRLGGSSVLRTVRGVGYRLTFDT